MNRKIAGLVLILVLFLSDNVLAANWVHVTTSWFGQDKMYVDTHYCPVKNRIKSTVCRRQGQNF